MKKQNVIAAVGTIALLANLLVPGLAFGQVGSSQQPATQVIGCPSESTHPLISFAVPAAVAFDTKTASGDAQLAFDQAVTNPAFPPQANMLVVTDMRSGGAEGCPDSSLVRGFNVSAIISSHGTDGALTLGLASESPLAHSVIPATQFRAVTTSNFDGVPTDMLSATAGVWYSHPADTAGNVRDVVAAYKTTGDLRTIATYTAAAGGGTASQLALPLDLLNTKTSHNGMIGTAVVLSSEIPANQNPGTYLGTITYTLTKDGI